MIIERADSGAICASVNDVFRIFWDARQWPQLTSHVTKVDMLEEHEGYQRYAMYVHVDGKDYALETQRISVAPKCICFQQPKPPVFMRSHAGLWTFEEGLSATKVTVHHRINADEQKAMEVLGVKSTEEARQKIQANLHKNGMAMIDSVGQFLLGQQEGKLQSAGMAK